MIRQLEVKFILLVLISWIMTVSCAPDSSRNRDLYQIAALGFIESKESCGVRMLTEVEARLDQVSAQNRMLVYSRFAQKEFYEYQIVDFQSGTFTGIFVDVSASVVEGAKNCVSAFYAKDLDGKEYGNSTRRSG